MINMGDDAKVTNMFHAVSTVAPEGFSVGMVSLSQQTVDRQIHHKPKKSCEISDIYKNTRKLYGLT